MQSFEGDVEKSLEILKNGGSILYPTDTVWGVGCDATNEDAVQKIYDIKQRPGDKSLIILLNNEREVYQYVAGVDPQVFNFIALQNKPVTIIYDGAIGLASTLIAADGTVAIRICNEPFCKTLLARFKKPIVSTSANISGYSTPAVFTEIADELKQKVDYIVNYRQADMQQSEPSMIVRWQVNGDYQVLRP